MEILEERFPPTIPYGNLPLETTVVHELALHAVLGDPQSVTMYMIGFRIVVGFDTHDRYLLYKFQTFLQLLYSFFSSVAQPIVPNLCAELLGTGMSRLNYRAPP